MVDVGSWCSRSHREAARCLKRVAGVVLSRRAVARCLMGVTNVGWSHRETARCSMQVADVGRSWWIMSRFEVHCINGGGGQ